MIPSRMMFHPLPPPSITPDNSEKQRFPRGIEIEHFREMG